MRTGFPQQMIEVHEPARLLIVVEKTTLIMDKVLVKLGDMREWVDNEWVSLVLCHPESRALSLYTKRLARRNTNGFGHHPYRPRSKDIYRQKKQTIPVAALNRSPA